MRHVRSQTLLISYISLTKLSLILTCVLLLTMMICIIMKDFEVLHEEIETDCVNVSRGTKTANIPLCVLFSKGITRMSLLRENLRPVIQLCYRISVYIARVVKEAIFGAQKKQTETSTKKYLLLCWFLLTLINCFCFFLH